MQAIGFLDQLLEAQERLQDARRGLSPTFRPLQLTLKSVVTSLSEKMPTDPKCEFHPAELMPCRVCDEHAAYRKSQIEHRLALRDQEKRLSDQARLASVGIGKRYANSSLDNFVPTTPIAQKVLNVCRRYVATFPERLASGDSLLMMGNAGTGKNHLAAAICHAVHDAGYTACHTRAIKMIRRIRQSWNGNSETEQEAIDLFVAPDLLVLDEVGMNYGSDAEKILLFDVLNERYENLKPTIVISNLALDGITEALGGRVMDRFREGKSRLLSFTWESYRGTQS